MLKFASPLWLGNGGWALIVRTWSHAIRATKRTIENLRTPSMNFVLRTYLASPGRKQCLEIYIAFMVMYTPHMTPATFPTNMR